MYHLLDLNVESTIAAPTFVGYFPEVQVSKCFKFLPQKKTRGRGGRKVYPWCVGGVGGE